MANNKKVPIPQRIYNASKEHPYVAGAVDIIDDSLNRNQQSINADTYRKNETYSKEQLNNLITTPEVNYVSVVATDETTPETIAALINASGEGETKDSVYRVGNWDGEQYDPTVYSEYAWDGTEYVFLDKKQPGIDDEPTPESNNLVKSGGVQKSITPIFSNMVDLGFKVTIPAGETYADVDISGFATRGYEKAFLFVDKPDIVSQVRLITSDYSALLIDVSGYITEKTMPDSDVDWIILRVIINSAQLTDTIVKLNFCDGSKVNIPTLFHNEEKNRININDLLSKIPATYSNIIDLGGEAVIASGNSYVDVDINHFSTTGSCLFFVDKPDIVSQLRLIDYNLVANVINIEGYITEKSPTESSHEWQFLRIQLTEVATENTTVRYQISKPSELSILSLQKQIDEINTEKITKVLPMADNYPIVVGNKLEIFKHSMCFEIYNSHDIFVKNDGKNFSNNYGNFRENAYWYEPSQGATDFSLEFNEVDYTGHIVAKREVNIRPLSKKGSPQNNVNVLIIGDSYTEVNVWCQELSRRLKGSGGTPVADGLTNITFVGTQNTVEGQVKTEGHSGWSIWNFIGSDSPFYNNGQIDIANYRSIIGVDKIDIVLILLGANGVRTPSSYKTLVDAFIADNEDTIFVLGTNGMKYCNNGWSNSLGLIAGLNTTQWQSEWREFTQAIQTEFAGYTNFHYLDIPCQVDIENNFGYVEVDANNRNSVVKVKQGTDNVHPADSGYLQIADAFYNAFHFWCLE